MSDETAISSEDVQVAAVMAVDRALELRRRAKIFEVANDVARADVLLKDGASQLERACAKLPHGSRIAVLSKSVLAAWHTSDFSQEQNVHMLEKLIAAEVDRLIGELGSAHRKGLGRAESAADDAESAVQARADLMSDLAVISPPSSPTKSKFSELVPMPPSSGSATGGSSERKFDGEAGNASGSKPGSARKPRKPGRNNRDSSSHPAQAALRVLHLDDEWPTDLTMGEIRRRYMREALQSHPDKGPPSEKGWRTTRFQDISNAYTTLETYIPALERLRGSQTERPQPTGSPQHAARSRDTRGFERSRSDAHDGVDPSDGANDAFGITTWHQIPPKRPISQALPAGACRAPLLDFVDARAAVCCKNV